MIDAEKMLGSLVRSALSGDQGRRGRRRRRRRSSMLGNAGKGALALGALGVAMGMYEHFSQKQATPAASTGGSTPPPLPPLPQTGERPPLPPLPVSVPEASTEPDASPVGEESEALLLVRAMIAAANADHELDDQERARILEALEEADGSAEEKTFLLDELETPLDVASLAAKARTPELANQIYLASCLAIEIDTRAERNYLDRLARRLGLEPDQARELEAMLEADDDAERGE